jgi:hypothetical protein
MGKSDSHTDHHGLGGRQYGASAKDGETPQTPKQSFGSDLEQSKNAVLNSLAPRFMGEFWQSEGRQIGDRPCEDQHFVNRSREFTESLQPAGDRSPYSRIAIKTRVAPLKGASDD